MWYPLIDIQRRVMREMAGIWPIWSIWQPWQPGRDTALNDAGHAFGHWLLRSTCAFEQAPPFDIDDSSSSPTASPTMSAETLVDALTVGVLRQFSRSSRPSLPRPWPVVLCAPLAGHHAVMLRETIETMLPERDVFVTDWADARDVPRQDGSLSLDDYVLALEHFICAARACGTPVHLMAVCQGTVPALAAAALLANARAFPCASISLLGGPLDTRLNPTLVDRFAASHTLDWFRNTVIDTAPPPYRGAGRRVYPGYIQQAAIIAAHPHRHLRLEADYWSNWLAGDMTSAARALRSLNEYAAVLDMAEAYFLDMIRVVFHEHLLPRQAWSVAERPVATAALRDTPLCTIEGEHDDIAAGGQTHCAHDLCHASSARRQITVAQCNHYDLFTGARWRDAVHPTLRDFWHEVECTASVNSCDEVKNLRREIQA